MVYIMNERYVYGMPGDGYYNTILEGYQSAGFDEKILQEAVHKSIKKGRCRKTMTPKIKEQLLKVRATSETNMFDINTVMVIANREEFYELVCYLADKKNHREYGQFIMSGKSEEEGDQ